MKLILVLLSIIVFVFAQAPSPNELSIAKITYGGSGCPQDSVTERLEEQNTKITLYFNEYSAKMGPGIPVVDSRKNCQITIQFDILNGGWQFSLSSANYSGNLKLSVGAVAQQSSAFYFEGSLNAGKKDKTFTAEQNGEYSVAKVFDDTTIWSECKRNTLLNLNSQVRISGPAGSSGEITSSLVSLKSTQSFGLIWRRC
ncbi:hypothetical protein HK099_008041 [Clydaea vesicula]|uniref:DUF4360 domain-containing protein n=1 Tax=Clydaea vesicula TaxID=447962 RepID=A0AAD5TW72_9FUNG|nr:hypothetical protein HK099_008041 [Clydaea vesicula]KAJ3391831.1 hypothetical protein HDU92_008799 [Lobulomyces angularis]